MDDVTADTTNTTDSVDTTAETTITVKPENTGTESTTTTTEGEGAPAGGEPDLSGAADAPLMFGDAALPEFTGEQETPREKELRLQLEELKSKQAESQSKPQPLTSEPVKPSRENFYSDDEYETAFEQYVTDKSRWQTQAQQQEQRLKDHQQQFNEAITHYTQGRADVAANLKDFDAVEKYADDNLDPNIVAAILFGGKEGTFSNPQNMIYAIGRQPELLKKLNAMSNPILAGAMLLDISQKSNFAPKAPVKPINGIPDAGGNGVTGLQAQLAAAEKEAETSGDRTKVIELRSQISAASKK